MTMKIILYFSLLLGFSSAIAQVLVMRVLAAALYGNEFIFVLVLAGWLIGVAAGSMVSGAMTSGKVRWKQMAAVLFLLAGFACPLTVLAARSIRTFLGISPGMLMDVVPASGIAFLVTLPLSILYGALFPVLVGWGREAGVSGGTARIYALEAAGFVVGGIIITFVFLPLLSAMSIAFVMLGLQVMAASQLSSRPRFFALAAFSVCAVLLASGFTRQLDLRSQAAQWPGFKILASRDTVYGHLQLLKKGEEKSLFENGLLVATTGDALSSEENVHYALLAHSSPQRLLLIGGGLAGGLEEALKHPGLEIDYVELDPAAIDMVRRHIPEVSVTMSDPRVRLIISDGRRFVKTTNQRYDVILVNLSDPLTLLVNRYYTEEFFRAVRRHLRPSGILALSVTSSENYQSREGRDYLRTLRRTLGMVFAEVRSIPGDRHIFLAAETLGTVSIEPRVLSVRLKQRGVTTKFVRDYYFNFRLDPTRVFKAERDLLGRMPVNSDTIPSGFLTALVFWSTHFQSGFSGMVQWFRGHGLALLVLPLGIGLVALVGRKRRLMACGSIVGVAGFCLIIYQLAVIMVFQSYYGYVYAGVGLVTAAFMGGIVLGATWAGRRISGEVVSKLQSVIVFSAVFALAIGVLLSQISAGGSDAVVLAGLPIFSLVAGCLGGAQFTLAVQYAGDNARNTGILYAVDVLGAAAGALLGGIFLIPLWGIQTTGLFCALLQAAALAALVRLGSASR